MRLYVLTHRFFFHWIILLIGLVDRLHEGIRDTYLEFFGQDVFRYFNPFASDDTYMHPNRLCFLSFCMKKAGTERVKNIGYYKLFRIAGRNLREFLFVIDQLHDSNRFTFAKMQTPSEFDIFKNFKKINVLEISSFL